jgi:N-acetylglutamate synthase/N-acetylornithine aminotransferase
MSFQLNQTESSQVSSKGIIGQQSDLRGIKQQIINDFEDLKKMGRQEAVKRKVATLSRQYFAFLKFFAIE